MELVKFYVEKGDLEKALETAEKGILEGEGGITELLEFLWEHFSKRETQPTWSGLCRQHYPAILKRRACWTGYLNITGQKAYRNIPHGNRKTYSSAVRDLEKAKNIYIDVLKNEAG